MLRIITAKNINCSLLGGRDHESKASEKKEKDQSSGLRQRLTTQCLHMSHGPRHVCAAS